MKDELGAHEVAQRRGSRDADLLLGAHDRDLAATLHHARDAPQRRHQLW
jgi:hypothetical protein